jgi:glycolate oxidase FAD binding subunit
MVMPGNVDELAEAVRAMPRLIAVGAGTKPRLAAAGVPTLSTSRLAGIIEYDPGEFTFTALAGTPVRDIIAALAERGQHLPFDPVLVAAGATLGGTVAAGISGPGRFRFGGIRDFILGVRFVDGMGRLLRMGGKVVKNAAGFDLPKFLVGSCGRFGVLAEVTFKVFPRPAATRTLQLHAAGIEAATRVIAEAATSRWQPDALDVAPNSCSVLMRLAGDDPALDLIAREVLGRWPGSVLTAGDAAGTWSDIREFRWSYPDGVLIKVPLTLAQVPVFHRAMSAMDGARIHFSAGGDVGFVALPEAGARLDTRLRDLGLSGLTLHGAAPLSLGIARHFKIDAAVKAALDPQQRFPALDPG